MEFMQINPNIVIVTVYVHCRDYPPFLLIYETWCYKPGMYDPAEQTHF